jgi:hypothetical protein
MHHFWSSHEEKRDCVRLSMGGQPWPISRSINGGMASSQERKGREGRGKGHSWGCGLGRRRAAGGAPWGLGPPCCCAVALYSHAAVAAHVRRNRKEEEEKREKRKEERKEKIKREIFSNLEISKK